VCTRLTFAVVQQGLEQELTARVTRLNVLISTVSSAGYLTPSDRSTLQADVSSELAGIQGLIQKVPGDTTCAQLRVDSSAMAFDNRVYSVRTSQVNLTIAADTASATVATLQGLFPTIEAGIAAAQKAGKDISAAQRTFGDLQSQVAGAQADLSGVSASVLAQTPAGAPANNEVFRGARTSITNARTDLHAASVDVNTIVRDLR
jgi:hypothetical protein